jgi:transcriptional regulator with XRE-family HTH domain
VPGVSDHRMSGVSPDSQPGLGSVALPPRVLDGDFAGWLRDAMAERGMTTRGLSMRTGIDHSTISRLMQGDRDPMLATTIELLRVLGPHPLRLPRKREGSVPVRRAERTGDLTP